MDTKISMIQAIKKRQSIRTFDKQPISSEDYKKIENYLGQEENLIGPFGRKAKIYLIPIKENVTDKGLKVGTYGIIRNPKAYIAGAVENNNEALVEFGYVFEKLFLYLTELNIGTCWLGGTFTRNSFEKEINFGANEVIPAITPIGYPAQKRSLVESTMRLMTKADNKKPWEDLFSYATFGKPLKEKDAGNFAIPIEMVRLGPSASNKQPWRIVLSEDKQSCHLYLAKTPGYAGNKMGYEMQRLDMGIAMCHFELACKESSISGDWVVKDPKIALLDENTQYIVSWEIG